MFSSRVVLFAALALVGCASSAPCSKSSLAKLEAECAARVKLFCAKGDRECPEYKECSAKIEAWRVCR